MWNMTRVSRSIAIAMSLLATPTVAFAQSRAEVTAGYTFLHAWRDVSFPADAPLRPVGSADFGGWEVTAAAYPRPAWGLTAVVGAQDRHVEEANIDATVRTFLGGIVVRAPRWQQLIPFTRVVAGAVRIDADDRDDPVPPDRTQTLPAVQVGGGADVMFSRRVGVRVAADYRRVFHARANHFSIFGGVVIPLH
jgi:hypothetical protein